MRTPALLVFLGLTSSLLSGCGGGPPPGTEPRTGAAPPTLAAQGLGPGTNTLQHEPPLYAQNGYGPAERNTSNGGPAAGDGRPLTLNGRVYPQGYGVHAPSDLRFSLVGEGGAQCTRLTAVIGVDDEVGRRGSVTFQVYLDGLLAFESAVFTGESAAQGLDLNLTGHQELRLVVTDANDGPHFDHADWADPRVTCGRASAAAGAFDPSFRPVRLEGAFDTALTPDGRLVVAADGAVARFRADGTPDGSFGRQGRLDAGAFSALGAGGRLLAVQPDGRIVLGLAGPGPGVLTRLHADGTLDTRFGENGRALLSVTPRALALQPDGKFLVAGNGGGGGAVSGWTVLRLSADGRPDPGFGGAGRVVTSFGGAADPDLWIHAQDIPSALALEPDGRFYVGGQANYLPRRGAARPGSLLAVARYTPDGTLDPTFRGNGRLSDAAYVRWGGGTQNLVRAMTVQPDGRLVVAGLGSGGPGCFVLRYLEDGRRDPAFGQDGVAALADPAASCYTLNDVTTQGDGRLLVAGSAYAVGGFTSFFRRLDASGVVDPSFQVAAAQGTDGGAVAVQSDGRILVGAGRVVRVLP